MKLAEVDDITIRRITTPEEARAWRVGFVGAYQAVFSGFPYFERFYPSEAEGIYRKLNRIQDSIVLVATRGATQVVGFSAAIPVTAKPDVSTYLTGLVPLRHTFYLAELGVVENHRGKGLGHRLVQERLRLIDPERFTQVVLRVSMNHNPITKLYEEMGFHEMGVHMDVSAMRTDGRVTTDRRMFMSRLLSQVQLSAS